MSFVPPPFEIVGGGEHVGFVRHGHFLSGSLTAPADTRPAMMSSNCFANVLNAVTSLSNSSLVGVSAAASAMLLSTLPIACSGAYCLMPPRVSRWPPAARRRWIRRRSPCHPC